MPAGRRALLGLPALLAGHPAAAATPSPGLGPGPGPGEVTLLVGAAPGRVADGWARSFAPFLERHWPQSRVSVLNRPGEGGLRAARLVAEAAPEARLLGVVATPLLLARAVERDALGLLDRLQFLAAVVEEPVVLVGPEGGNAETLAGLRALGDAARIATPPPGSAPHLAAASLGGRIGMDLLAFPNGGAARQAVLAGNIPAAMLALPDAIGALRDGRLLALGLASRRRSPLLPETPTLEEQGVAVDIASHRGFMVPAGLAPERLAPLLRALRAAVEDPEFAAQAESRGHEPRFLGPEAWQPILHRSTDRLLGRWSGEPWVQRLD